MKDSRSTLNGFGVVGAVLTLGISSLLIGRIYVQRHYTTVTVNEYGKSHKVLISNERWAEIKAGGSIYSLRAIAIEKAMRHRKSLTVLSPHRSAHTVTAK